MAAESSFDSPMKHANDTVTSETSHKGAMQKVESSSTCQFEGKHSLGLASASFGCGESREMKTDVVNTDSHLDLKTKRGFQEPENLSSEDRVDLESLDFKKLQLLRDLEAGSIFGGITDSVENAVMVDGNVIVGEVGKIEDRYEVDRSDTGSLKIKLIDETAVIEPFTGLGIDAGHQKKAKRPRRKGKGGKKAKMVFQNNCGRDGGRYSREELLAMRFVGVVKQKRLWREIYDGLGGVAEEYASLVGSKNPKPRNPVAPGILGEESCKEESTEQLRSTEHSEQNNVHFSNEGHSANALEQEFEEDSYDSDEYYGSIQRPAFAVEGEPNFDAGPPEDGLEYLRRVRWEAARIPKVKVAKLEKNKLNKEQTAYMPVIPDIPKCPDHLMPTEEWEEAFLADFSRLRLALSQADAARAEMSSDLQQQPIVVFENPDFCVDDSHPDRLNEEEEAVLAMVDTPSTFDILGSFGVSISMSNTLSLVLAMDSVSRVSNLKKRISEFEMMTALSRESCVWLFALCAAVDTPFHADTCASVRSLLRKCASLRAEKVEADEEVVMLNIVATICGSYFGQSDSDTTREGFVRV